MELNEQEQVFGEEQLSQKAVSYELFCFPD
jgi:hypothetical protein